MTDGMSEFALGERAVAGVTILEFVGYMTLGDGDKKLQAP